MEPVTPSSKRRGNPPSGEHTEISSSVGWQEGLADDLADDPGLDTPTRKTELGQLDVFDLPAGTPIKNDYRIERKLGQGGMGVVYVAVHPRIGARAAVKILKRELCQDPFQIERFIDEARIVNEIRHPNIVDVFDFGELPDGRSYCLMELLEGESLYARLERAKPLSVDEVATIVLPLTSALAAAHDKGVIHRDLKPDNIFLVDVHDDLPLVKLLDFGIAKLARDDHRAEKTATGAMVGTPQYIAPEQAKGYAIDPRADIYALGGIMFEMLVGEPPFVADNPMEIVAKHLIEPPRHPNTLVRGLAIELDELIVAMLDKDPNHRPTLARVCEVLERASTRRSHSYTAATSLAVALPATLRGTAGLPSDEIAAPPRPAATMPPMPDDQRGAVPVSGTIDGPAPAPRPLIPAGPVSKADPVAPRPYPPPPAQGKPSSARFYLLAIIITVGAAIGTYFLVRSLGPSKDRPAVTSPDAEVAPAITPPPPPDAAPVVEAKPMPPEVKSEPPEKPVRPAAGSGSSSKKGPELLPPWRPNRPPPNTGSSTVVKPATGSGSATKPDPMDRSHPGQGSTPNAGSGSSSKKGMELLEPGRR